jgi:hypothetical protein
MIDLENRSNSPKLRVSNAKKKANDYQHTKLVMDSYIQAGTFLNQIINPDLNERDVRVFYYAYNNKLPDSYFDYVLNPLNSAKKEYTNWPARLRPYSIIRPNIDLIEGEYERRPFSWTVKVHNADALNIAQEQIYNDILASLQQQFINKLNESGTDTGQPSQQAEPPEQIKAAYESNYRDTRANIADTALSILVDELRIEETLKKIFGDWTKAGESYSYKGIRGNKLVYERVSPLDIQYDKSPDVDYIEDGQWAIRRIYMTLSEVIDRFYEELSEAEIDLMSDESGYLSFGTSLLSPNQGEIDLRRSKVVVYHCTWKYLTQIGILSYPNPMTGEVEEIEVPEGYKADKTRGEEVKWYWVNEAWEGYRMSPGTPGTTANHYFGIRPIPGQRNTVNNLSICKLPYNGRRFSDVHAQNTSLVELGMPYEIFHRILHFQMEKTIAKSKGKILMMDFNAIPKKFGWDEEKWAYWAEALGYGFVDRNQPGADKQFNQYAAVDMGLYQHINNLIELMTFVKQEWDEVLGITRQRKGQTESSDTATGNKMAVSQSTTMSEKIFSKFEEFSRCELQGILDLSKIAWSDGHQQIYQGDDMRSQFLSIDPGQYTEMDMGVYISRSPRDLMNLELARQQVQSFAQNGVAPSTIVDILQAKSLSKLKSALIEAEQKATQAQQSAMGAEQEGEERLEMMKSQYAELQAVLDERLMNAEYDRKEEIEHIKGAYSTYRNVEGTGDNNQDGVPDALEVQKIFDAREATLRKELVDREKIASSERMKARDQQLKVRDQDIKLRELQVRERIADKNNATALKNKVAGEKAKSKTKK